VTLQSEGKSQENEMETLQEKINLITKYQKPYIANSLKRMVKECIDELGHVFGFVHCSNTLCVMHFSNSLNDTALKARDFCDRCRMKKPIF
jgi:predicted Zn-dependent protease